MSWISVNDRLPENSDSVLVYTSVNFPFPNKGVISKYIYIGSFYKGKFIVDEPEIFEYPCNYFEGSYQITHWMPLPDVPKDMKKSKSKFEKYLFYSTITIIITIAILSFKDYENMVDPDIIIITKGGMVGDTILLKNDTSIIIGYDYLVEICILDNGDTLTFSEVNKYRIGKLKESNLFF